MRESPSGGAPEASAPQELAALLRGSGLTVSVAESMTGGMIGTMITGQPGSSLYFVGGVIAYSNDLKREELGVAAELLESVGAVSPEVAEAMAQGVRSRLGTNLAVAVTGIAGPAADGTTKPVGLTYIAVASEGRVVSREFRFEGDRTVIRHRASTAALRMLIAEARSVARAGLKTA
ncbi:MAG: nicotinamide-nucleotide amidohydrolase family protein [Chloroflexi bacterium]|nr:MAG: nicotinamide-nucleotide amidohydrolase family protein [Chloroflexota bacterium]